MAESIRELFHCHWDLANEPHWEEFAMLLHADLRYEVPQTREYIESALEYLEMFRTWPGDWRAEAKELVREEHKAINIIDFKVGTEVTTGITVFGVSDGKVIAVTDYWPDPYEPPPRQTTSIKRRPSEAQPFAQAERQRQAAGAR